VALPGMTRDPLGPVRAGRRAASPVLSGCPAPLPWPGPHATAPMLLWHVQVYDLAPLHLETPLGQLETSLLVPPLLATW
jgi:hypothetical protein